MHAHTSTHECTHTHTHTHVHTHTHTRTHTYACTHANRYTTHSVTRMCIHTYAQTHKQDTTYTHIRMCIQTHNTTHTKHNTHTLAMYKQKYNIERQMVNKHNYIHYLHLLNCTEYICIFSINFSSSNNTAACTTLTSLARSYSSLA